MNFDSNYHFPTLGEGFNALHNLISPWLVVAAIFVLADGWFVRRRG